MSHSRQKSGRLAVRGGLLLLVVCGLVAGSWKAGWLPAGMQGLLDHFAASLRSDAQQSIDSKTGDKFAAIDARREALLEQEMREAGEQFEPEGTQQDGQAPAGQENLDPTENEPANPDEAQPIDELADRSFPAAGRQRRPANHDERLPDERHSVRQIHAESEAAPFDEPTPAKASRAVARANFEEELSVETEPLAAGKADQSKLPPAKQPGKVPVPVDDPGDAIVDAPARKSNAPQPIDAAADRTTLNTTDPASSKNGALMDMKLITRLREANDFISAQRELSRWYWKDPASRSQIRKQLDEMAQSLYFSPHPHYREAYVVQPGDQLRVIAQRYKLSWEYLSKLNLVDARKIRVGQKLKVVDGPFSAIVSLGSHELIIHLNGSFVRSYRVGLGKDGSTPTGTFTVKNKQVDPTYYGPDGLVMAHDDPKNPLGERWIDIGDSYGIHGTIDPSSIGKNESRGCIRMLNADVEEVYDLLVIGSQVKIQK